MKRMCAWCGAELGDIFSSIHPPEAITHGICPRCHDRLAEETGETLSSFLERLEVPILLLDGASRVFSANKPAQRLLGKSLPEIANRPEGEVIECVHASEPGGCGGTVHCKSCTIRRTVKDTFDSGTSYVHVPAYQDIRTPNEIKQIRFLISAEKAGDFVILRIDEMQNPPPR
jgi:PAS domain-containing protein